MEDRNLLLRPDVVSALAAIGYPHTWIDSAAITNRTDFQEMLRDALTSAATELFRSDYLTMLARADVELPRLRDGGGKALQCRGDGLTMTTVVGRWTSRAITGQIPPAFQERQPAAFRGFLLSADVTALVLQDETGSLIEAQLRRSRSSADGFASPRPKSANFRASSMPSQR